MTNTLTILRGQFEADNPVPFGVFWSEPDSRYMTTMVHLKCLEYQGKWLGWQSAILAAPVVEPAKCGICGQGAWACNEGGCHYLESGNGAPLVERQPVADSIAQMVTEWVETGIKMNTDWRNGLSGIIEKRLARFPASPPAPVAVALDPREWSDSQILDFLGVALRNVDLSGEVKLSEIRQGFEYVRQNSCLDKVKELNQ